MNEQIQLARRYARMLWPYRWPSLALAAAICFGGWFHVFTLPNIYEVSTRVFVDTRSMLRPLLKGLAINTDTLASEASLMQQTLLTRPNLEEVARKTDLDLKAKNEKEFSQIVESLAKRIKITGTSRDNIYKITFEDSNAEQAKRVVDEMLNTFLEGALGTNRQDTAVTQKFLDEQIAEYERRLVEAEDRLKEFKQRNVGLMPGEGGTYYEELQRARELLKHSTLELEEAKNRATTLKQQLDGEEPVFGIMGMQTFGGAAGFTSEYDSRIRTLQEQLDQLMLQYTEKHPDVAAIREQIEIFEARRTEEREVFMTMQAQAGPAAPEFGGESNVLQDVKLALASADGEVSALTARVAAHAKNVEELERAVDTVPEIEAELKRLDRDYELNKKQFAELLSRRESARLSEEMDQKAEDVKLKVIEPPRLPLVPVGPDRAMLLTMVLAASLGAAGALAFLMSQISPRFYASEELKEVTRLPVLGAVSLVFNRRQRTERRMELAVFATVLLGLLTVYGGLVSLEAAQFDLHAKLKSFMEDVV